MKVIEPLGKETLIRSEIPNLGVQVNVQAGVNVPVDAGDRLFLGLDLENLFVFDSNTGDKLYP